MKTKLPEPKQEFTLVFDTVLRRPGCVILQAALGGDTEAANFFSSSTWLVAPTPDMQRYRVSRPLLERIAEQVRKEWDEKLAQERAALVWGKPAD